MKLITKIEVQQADHTQVIDSAATQVGKAANKAFLFVITAATQVGRAANKAFLFVIHKEIQGWKNFTVLCSWGLSKVGDKHGPIYEEVKGSAIAVFRKGCSQETAFVQGLIKEQLMDRLNARWEQHNKAFEWFKDQTQAFLADSPVEDSSEVESEDQVPDITEELKEPAPVDEIEEPVDEVEESPIAVLDPPVDPDPLEDDELSIPEDPAPVVTKATPKRRSAKKKVEASLAGLIREEAGKV